MSPNPAFVQQTVTLTATVTGSSPTGTITFKDGTTSLGTATLSGGQATLTKSFTTTGTHSLTASYGGDTNNSTSTSSAASLKVNAKTATSVSLAASPSPALVGQAVVLTATVTGTSPTGTVTFKDGTTTLGSVAVSSGKATYSATFTTSGAHSLTASYGGDTGNASSTSSAKSLTVNKVTSTTALMVSPSPALVSQTVVLTATVTGTNPSGTVTFKDGTTTLGTGNVSAGKATYSATFATTGSHSLTASYGGDTANNTSTSSAVALTVNPKTTTTTTLTASPSPALMGQAVTLTATISISSATGTVTFKDGTTTLGTAALSGGSATFSTTFGAAGAHSLTAVYGGDAANATSTSSTVSLTVNKVTSTTSLSVSPSPALVGQSVVLTASVSGSSPTGTVTFKDGTTTLGTATISSGQATYSATFSTTGSHSLTASYGGDTVNNTSTSSAVALTVNPKATTTTTLNASPSPAVVGQSVTLTASVLSSLATGTVTFKDGTTTLGTATLSSGSATLSTNFSTTGAHSLTAVYGGDAANATSTSSAFNLTVNSKPNTTTSLIASPNPTGLNQTVTMSATVTGSNPTGTVTFKDGTTTLGTATLVSGVAKFAKSFSTAGSHSLTAVYGGDAGNAISTSTAVPLTVNSVVASTTTMTVSKTTALTDEYIDIDVSVSGSSPTGTVELVMDGFSLTTSVLSGGSTNFGISFGGPGAHVLSINYLGDARNTSSSSTPVTVTINPKPISTTSISITPNPAVIGESVAFIATVLGSEAAIPTGTVTFKDDRQMMNWEVSLVGGRGEINLSSPTPFAANVRAEYSGDSNYPPSVSVATQFAVFTARSTTSLSISRNPSHSGDVVTITASVNGSNPSGQVTFRDGESVLGTVTLSGGSASLSSTFAEVGNHNITATYVGDSENTPSAANAKLVVGPTSTTTSLFTAADNVVIGQGVQLIAGVSGFDPTGVVTFYDGSNPIMSVAVTNSSAVMIAQLGLGSHKITAHYSGDAANPASTSSISTVNVSPTVTGTAIYSNVNPSAIGQTITLSATVNGYEPSGMVSFMDGASMLGQAPVINSVARLSVSLNGAGTHALTAVYAGDTNNGSSTSDPLSLLVQGSAVVVTATPNPAAASQPVSFAVSVAGSNSTGTVTIFDGNTSVGSGALASGSASLNLSLTAGAHSITATYSGDASNPAGKSDPIAVNVLPDPASATGAAPMTWNYWYDAKGNLKTLVDPLGNQTDNGYDALNRNTSITQPFPNGTSSSRPGVSLGYNGQDALTSVTDPRSLTTSYTLDGLGNLWSLTSPDTGITRSTPDALGKKIDSTDARNKNASYTYDQLDRLTRIDYPTGAPTVYEYDGGQDPAPNSIGRLTKITDESGSTSYTYDGFGHVLTKTQVIGSGAGAKTLQTNYYWGNTGFEAGKLVSIDYPSGMSVVYTYDITGRLSSVLVDTVGTSGEGWGDSRPILGNITYTATGAISGWSWGSGLVYQRIFDSLDQLISYPLGNPTGTGLSAGVTRTLAYDGTGQITGYTHANQSGSAPSYDQSFSYDGLGRLTSNRQAAVTYGYAYDANGNLSNKTIGPSSYAFKPSLTSNRLDQIQYPSGNSTITTNYGYDAAGHITSDGVATYEYSDRGRMRSATVSGGTVSYLYNALEQRVSKSGPSTLVNTGAAYYAYDEAGQLLGEYDANLVPLYETVYVGSLPIAVVKQTRTGSGATLNVQTDIANVYADHLATPRVITRSTDDAILWRWDGAEAYGNTAANDNPSALGSYVFNQRFPGQVYDKEIGSFYNINRNYSPLTGRYLQSDPIGLQGGLNTYGYVGGNPVSSSDFFGLQAVMGGAAGGAAGGSGLGGLGAAGGAGGRGSGGMGSGRQSFPDDGNGRASCTLYHIVDCAGETVYVGITQQDPRARENQHTNRPDGKIKLYECVNCKLTYTPIRTYHTRSECEAAETREIVALRPFANDLKNPDSRTMQYQKYQEWFSKRCIPCQ